MNGIVNNHSSTVYLTRSNSQELHFADGEKYVGETLNNQPHGQGTYFYSNGSMYVGKFCGGLRHGQGIYFFASGDRYEGEFCDGRREGKGTYFFAGGNRYVGEFDDNKFQGEGIYISDGGTSSKLQFLNDEPISDISHLCDSLFLQLLSQQFRSSVPDLYPLGIMINYLLSHGYEEVGRALQEVRLNFFRTSPKTEQGKAKKIYRKLQLLNQPALLLLRSKRHVMGLQMRQTCKGWVDFEIYNSGDGLSHHKRHPKYKQKYRTAWKRRVPIANLTLKHIKEFLGTFKDADAPYLAVSRLPGVKTIPKERVVWQKGQKANNCTLMWIFAYLKNTMEPQDYIDMCTLLFTKALAAAKQASEPNQKLIDSLQEKVDKLMKKCFPVTASPDTKKRPRPTYSISTRASSKRANTNPSFV